MTPIGSPSRRSGTPSAVLKTPKRSASDHGIALVRGDVFVVKRAAFVGRAPDDGFDGIGADRMLFDEALEFVREAVGRPEPVEPIVEAEQERPAGTAEARRGFHQGVEDRLQVDGGPADGLEHVAGRGLVGQRLGELAGALLDLGFEGAMRFLDLLLPCC